MSSSRPSPSSSPSLPYTAVTLALDATGLPMGAPWIRSYIHRTTHHTQSQTATDNTVCPAITHSYYFQTQVQQLTFKLRTRRCWVFSPRTKLIASIKLLLPVKESKRTLLRWIKRYGSFYRLHWARWWPWTFWKDLSPETLCKTWNSPAPNAWGSPLLAGKLEHTLQRITGVLKSRPGFQLKMPAKESK